MVKDVAEIALCALYEIVGFAEYAIDKVKVG